MEYLYSEQKFGKPAKVLASGSQALKDKQGEKG